MAVRKFVREAMASLDVDLVEYRVDLDVEADVPGVCGLALVRDGKDVVVLEQVPRGWGGDGKWWVCRERSTPSAEAVNTGKGYATQREALAFVVRAGYV